MVLPNSLSSLNAYAGLWSHLKSIYHTLDKVISQREEITELDKELLENTRSLLLGLATESEHVSTNDFVNDLVTGDQKDMQIGVFDVRDLVEGIDIPSTPKAFDKRIKSLANSIGEFLKENALFAGKVPKDLKAVQDLVRVLLAETEHPM